MKRTKKYYGEEAEILSPAEAKFYADRLAAMTSDDLLACMVEAPKVKPVAVVVE